MKIINQQLDMKKDYYQSITTNEYPIMTTDMVTDDSLTPQKTKNWTNLIMSTDDRPRANHVMLFMADSNTAFTATVLTKECECWPHKIIFQVVTI